MNRRGALTAGEQESSREATIIEAVSVETETLAIDGN